MNYGDVRGNADHDSNDCSVVATAIVTGIPYVEAQSALATAGRKRHGRFAAEKYENVIRGLGFIIDKVIVQSKTVRTLERELAAKWGGVKVMINTRGHVLAWDGSKIVDWTAGRTKRIKYVQTVYPIGSVPVGKSVPVPKQQQKTVTARPRSAIIAYIEGNEPKQYRSVKAFYDANGLNLHGHQKNRLLVKHYGYLYFAALQNDEAVDCYMKLDK